MNKALLGLAAIAAAGWMNVAQAAAPVLHVMKSAKIDAPPAKVWAVIENFGDLTWVPAVKASAATTGNTPGSVRTLDLGGPKLVEELKTYNSHRMTYTYAITDDPANVKTLPVTDYTSTITVRPAPKGASLVTWTGRFKRADPSAKPADGMDDKTAMTTMAGVYTAGLDSLKAKAAAN